MYQYFPLQLRRPADPGISQFWVDFNLGSQTVAMFVEDPYMTGCGDPEDSMWEYVAIRKDALKHWATEGKTCDTFMVCVCVCVCVCGCGCGCVWVCVHACVCVCVVYL